VLVELALLQVLVITVLIKYLALLLLLVVVVVVQMMDPELKVKTEALEVVQE
jgi:hypothetical protein